jgi:hypothetical protein
MAEDPTSLAELLCFCLSLTFSMSFAWRRFLSSICQWNKGMPFNSEAPEMTLKVQGP